MLRVCSCWPLVPVQHDLLPCLWPANCIDLRPELTLELLLPLLYPQVRPSLPCPLVPVTVRHDLLSPSQSSTPASAPTSVAPLLVLPSPLMDLQLHPSFEPCHCLPRTPRQARLFLFHRGVSAVRQGGCVEYYDYCHAALRYLQLVVAFHISFKHSPNHSTVCSF